MAFLWTEVEKSPQGVQAVFFNELLERERISSFRDIRRGDHIIFKTSISDSYYHHCLCIDYDAEGNPTVMHYWGTALGAVLGISGTSSKNFGAVAKIEQMQLPNKEALADEADFKKKDAKRIVWPNDMRRFSVDETIERALSREGESFYDFAKNNCEHFVMWCMCGINTSLQVKDSHFVLRETLHTVKDSLLHTVKSQVSKLTIEGILNAVDDAGVAVTKFVTKGGMRGLSKLSVGLSVSLGALVETLVCGYYIHQTYKQWNDEVLIKSREEFMQKVTEIVIAGVGRFGWGAFGAVIGQMVIPIPFLGALIGSLVGAGLGHILGTFLGKYAGRAVCWLARTFQNLFG